MKTVFSIILLLLVNVLFAQKVFHSDEQDVIRVVENFSSWVTTGDSENLSQIILPDAILSESKLVLGNLEITSLNLSDLSQKKWKNKRYVYVPQVNIRSSFALVYAFFTAFDLKGNKKCGTEHFQLVKQGEKWWVSEYSETIDLECNSVQLRKQELDQINNTLNDWHGLAAVGDTSYFDHFSQGSFYLGTDAKEVWSLQEFKDFALPHFRRGSAWSFKNKSRNVHLGDYGHYAWFDEVLDTWMGLCRGTGVMEKQANGWKIKHYSLTVLVSNNHINEYIKLIKSE